MDEATLEKVK